MKMELVQTQQKEVIPIETLETYLDSMGLTDTLDKAQKQQFIHIAEAFGLNPFKREIYAVAYYDRQKEKNVLSIITGYEVYIKRAERTGKLNGWNARVEKTEDGKDAVGIVTIYRKDWDEPFEHQVFFSEVAQRKKNGELTSFWKKSPRFQLKKVAISQGFRMCFPDELGGMPYTDDEMPDEKTGRVTPEPRDVTEENTHSPDPHQSPFSHQPTNPQKNIRRPSPTERKFVREQLVPLISSEYFNESDRAKFKRRIKSCNSLQDLEEYKQELEQTMHDIDNAFISVTDDLWDEAEMQIENDRDESVS